MEPRTVLFLGDDRERIAYHESGHVIIAVAEKLGLRYARIAPEPEVITNMWLNRAPWPCVAARVKFTLEATPPTAAMLHH